LQQDFIKNEIRAAIIRQYGDYEYNKKLITVKNKAYLSTQMQVEKANFDYENGNLTIYDLTKVMEASTKAETEYLKAQIDFKIAYLLLLEIIGVNNFNTKQ
jgi:outer membrane protein TolC